MQQKIIITTSEEISGLKNELSEFKEYLDNYSSEILKPKLLPAHKTAEYFSVTENTLSEYAERGHYKKYKFGDRKVFYQIKEIEEYILNSVKNKD